MVRRGGTKRNSSNKNSYCICRVAADIVIALVVASGDLVAVRAIVASDDLLSADVVEVAV